MEAVIFRIGALYIAGSGGNRDDVLKPPQDCVQIWLSWMGKRGTVSIEVVSFNQTLQKVDWDGREEGRGKACGVCVGRGGVPFSPAFRSSFRWGPHLLAKNSKLRVLIRVLLGTMGRGGATEGENNKFQFLREIPIMATGHFTNSPQRFSLSASYLSVS
jgi:hypothetical protein